MIKSTFASSHNPEEVSLTVSSIFKVVIFLVAMFATQKGFDVSTATNNVEAIRDIVISLVPACFALYHGCQAVYGLVRKMFIAK